MNKKDQKLKNKILENIQNDHIEPKASWRFTAHNLALWLPVIISIIVGAIVVSAIIFNIINAGWEYAALSGDNTAGTFFGALPYLWIILMIGLLILGINRMRHTKHGYRYKTLSIILVVIVGSITLGGVSYAVGMGARTDNAIGRHLPLQSSPQERLAKIWSQPERGRLVGTVNEVYGEETMSLSDPSGNDWIVDITDAVSGPLELVPEISVFAIGFLKDDQTFHACVITPAYMRGVPKSGKHIKHAHDVKKRIIHQIKTERKADPARINECRDLRLRQQSL